MNTNIFKYKEFLLFSLIFIFAANSISELVAQDPLTIDQSGNAMFSGNVGIGLKLPGTSKFVISNSNSDYIDYNFSNTRMGQLQFVGWPSGWNINTKTVGKNLYLNRDSPKENDVYIGRNGKELTIDGETGNVGAHGTLTANKLIIKDGVSTGKGMANKFGETLCTANIGNKGGMILLTGRVAAGGFEFSMLIHINSDNSVIAMSQGNFSSNQNGGNTSFDIFKPGYTDWYRIRFSRSNGILTLKYENGSNKGLWIQGSVLVLSNNN